MHPETYADKTIMNTRLVSIPACVIEALPTLPEAVVRVMLVLCARCDNDQLSTVATASQLARAAGIKPRSVFRAFLNLETNGWITRAGRAQGPTPNEIRVVALDSLFDHQPSFAGTSEEPEVPNSSDGDLAATHAGSMNEVRPNVNVGLESNGGEMTRAQSFEPEDAEITISKTEHNASPHTDLAVHHTYRKLSAVEECTLRSTWPQPELHDRLDTLALKGGVDPSMPFSFFLCALASSGL